MTITLDDIDFGVDDLPDYHERLAELRERHGDHAEVTVFGVPSVMLLSEELVLAAFGDEETLPSMLDYGPKTKPLGRTLQTMTGAEHRKNRALVSPEFRRQLMGNYIIDLLEPVANELIDEFVADGRADLVSQFTRVLPERVIEGLLDLPIEYRDRCSRWAMELFMYNRDPEIGLNAARAFTEMLQPLVTQRRIHPGQDLISKLATAEVDGERLTDEEIFSFVRLLFPAGVDTTYLNLGNTIRALLTHPDQLAHVLVDPSLIPWAGEETMRWDPAVTALQRVAPTDLVWHGIELTAGQTITMSMAAAGRDPKAWDDPDRFDVTRRTRPRTVFGHGPHVCLGMWLARAELEVGLRTVLRRLPGLRLVDPEGAAVRNCFGAMLRGPERLDVEFEVTP